MAEGGCTGKGFTKGDPRINRNGRPKSFDALRKLAQQLAHEEAQSKGVPIVIDGHKATNAEMILRDLMRAHPERFLEIAFGKVPNPIDITSGGEKLEATQFVIKGADPEKL